MRTEFYIKGITNTRFTALELIALNLDSTTLIRASYQNTWHEICEYDLRSIANNELEDKKNGKKKYNFLFLREFIYMAIKKGGKAILGLLLILSLRGIYAILTFILTMYIINDVMQDLFKGISQTLNHYLSNADFSTRQLFAYGILTLSTILLSLILLRSTDIEDKTVKVRREFYLWIIPITSLVILYPLINTFPNMTDTIHSCILMLTLYYTVYNLWDKHVDSLVSKINQHFLE